MALSKPIMNLVASYLQNLYLNPIRTKAITRYNLSESNANDDNLDKLDSNAIPDVFLVKKFYGERSARRRARMWKLKHMADEIHDGRSSTNEDYNEFLDDLEEDPAFRQNINIFRDASKIAVDTDEIDPTLPRITLAEMLDDLNIEDEEMTEV